MFLFWLNKRVSTGTSEVCILQLDAIELDKLRIYDLLSNFLAVDKSLLGMSKDEIYATFAQVYWGLCTET